MPVVDELLVVECEWVWAHVLQSGALVDDGGACWYACATEVPLHVQVWVVSVEALYYDVLSVSGGSVCCVGVRL